MAIMITDSANYTAIADAIRAKGVEGNFTPTQMADAISSIIAGGGGNAEYIPTEYKVIPGIEKTKYIFTYQMYGYTQSMDLVWEFEEPTTEVLYFNGMTNTGISAPQIFFNDSTTAASTFTQLRNGNGKAYESVEIPIGTTKIRFTDSNYITDYQKQSGFYISKSSIGFGTNNNDYLTHWNEASPIDTVAMPVTFTATYNADKVIMEKSIEATPDKIEVNIQGYLQVSIDDVEYKIMEAEGGLF